MSLRGIFVGISFMVAVCGCLVGNLSYWSMIDALNQQRPANEQISKFGSNINSFDYISDYRRLYPAGRLFLRYVAGAAIMIAGFISVILCVMLI
jgi:hypothetical protein